MDSVLHSYSLQLVFFAACFYIVYGAIYRIFYSPIARFPGPRLAALTFWYEFYYDVVCKGRYSWKIQELHKEYGPVVRINPEELHVADPAFYDNIYVGPGRRTEKWDYSARQFGTKTAAVGTLSHELHRTRRGALSSFFSKRAVAHLEPAIKQLADTGCGLLKTRGECGRVLNLRNFYAAFSADVIGQVAFGTNYALLAKEDFEPGWQKLMMDLSRGTHLMKQFPWAYAFLKTIPQSVVSLIHPPGTHLFRIRNDINLKVEEIKTSLDLTKDVEEVPHRRTRPTALELLLTSTLPVPELETPRLEDEAFTLLGAGTITTAHTLTMIVYHILANPKIKQELQRRLDYLHAALPEGSSSPPLAVLEHEPYVQAIVAEGLRLSFGVSHRLPRVSPDTALHYSGIFDGKSYDYVVPPGVPVSMTSMFMHLDPTIFPAPCVFDPCRWTTSCNNSAEQDELKRRRAHLVPFSKGTRSCAGMWLAYAELYIMLGTLFAPQGVGRQMKLFDTSIDDVKPVHDFFNPSPRLDSKGVRVVLEAH